MCVRVRVCACACVCVSMSRRACGCFCACACVRTFVCAFVCAYAYVDIHIQPIADRVALNLEIIVETFSTNQNSGHGIYD